MASIANDPYHLCFTRGRKKGKEVVANAELSRSTRKGLTVCQLKASVNIKNNDEIFWSYGKDFKK